MNANRAIAELFKSHLSNPIHIRASFLHSSPILERRRRTNWDSVGSAYYNKGSSKRYNNYQKKRAQKFYAKHTLLRNVSAFAEDFFQNLHNDYEEYESSSNRGRTWFRQDFSSNPHNSSRSRNKGRPQWREFHFTEDLDLENFLRTGCGGFVGNTYRWSFINEDERQRQRHSSRYSNSYRNSRWHFIDDDEEVEEEHYYDDASESEMYESDLTSERLALGLKASGPLNIEDVKNAYRTCALKWHPDRHQGPSKAVAEEKFKACSAAYELLCNRMALS